MAYNVRTMVLGVILLLSGATASGQTILYVDSSATGPGHDGSSWCTAFTELHEALAVVTAGSIIRVADGVYRADPTGLADPREATFALSSGVTIEGGYAGCGAPDPDQRDIEQNETILSGDLLANDPDIDDYRGCCNSTFAPGCPDETCAAAVCAEQSLCCDIQWQTSCAELAADLCSTLCDSKDDNAYHVVTASGTDETAVLDGAIVMAGFANVGNIPSDQNVGAGMYMIGGSPT
ncbi:MAG: hypothetical protein IIC01_11645, partial [Planctomycetes bacterium]|nr:hypothetical protein [Planctomycetota bacterium]